MNLKILKASSSILFLISQTNLTFLFFISIIQFCGSINFLFFISKYIELKVKSLLALSISKLSVKITSTGFLLFKIQISLLKVVTSKDFHDSNIIHVQYFFHTSATTLKIDSISSGVASVARSISQS
jgi:hypothetical protein